jgi:hypothetical protein
LNRLCNLGRMADGGVLLYRWTAWLCADIQGRSREQWEKSEDRMRVGKGRRSLFDIESGEERVGEVGLGIYIYWKRLYND